ncbi:hypothetical protein V6N13_028392 [Hibiscus sabdariffa]
MWLCLSKKNVNVVLLEGDQVVEAIASHPQNNGKHTAISIIEKSSRKTSSDNMNGVLSGDVSPAYLVTKKKSARPIDGGLQPVEEQ